MATHLLGRGRHAGHGPAVLARQAHQVAGGEDRGVSRDREVGVDLDASRAVERRVQAASQRRGRDARRPHHGARADETSAEPVALGGDLLHRLAGRHVHAQALELFARAPGQAFIEARQDPRPGLDQADPGPRRIDVAELALQCVACDLGQGAGQFDAGGPAPDDRETQPGIALGRVGGRFGALEGQQQAPAQVERVVERLEPGRVRGPVVVAEVGLGRAAGQKQIVERHPLAAGQFQAPVGGLDPRHRRHAHHHVLLPPQDLAQRRGDVRRRQPGGRHLVEHRLEQVVVAAVDQGDAHRRRAQRAHGSQPGETAADDHHMGKRLPHARSLDRAHWPPVHAAPTTMKAAITRRAISPASSTAAPRACADRRRSCGCPGPASRWPSRPRCVPSGTAPRPAR